MGDSAATSTVSAQSQAAVASSILSEVTATSASVSLTPSQSADLSSVLQSLTKTISSLPPTAPTSVPELVNFAESAAHCATFETPYPLQNATTWNETGCSLGFLCK